LVQRVNQSRSLDEPAVGRGSEQHRMLITGYDCCSSPGPPTPISHTWQTR
jgi:hypothetical protein